jgi:flagellar hook-length control protein FliK
VGSQNGGTQAPGAAADDSNASGLNILQLLAQSLGADDSAAPSDSLTTQATDKSNDDNTSKGDTNAIALAQFTQALAAALGPATAASQTGTANASPTANNEVSVTDIAKGGSSASDLVAQLARDIAADSQGKSDADAPRSDVTTAKDSSADNRAVTPNSLPQLGVASHFSLQHTQQASNTGELQAPMGSAAWNDELGTQLTWMTQKGLETGSLRVSPEHLGPVEVKISVQNGDASVWFGANHPDTRAALEQALPRLREMFASQGMTLTDSGVSRDPPRNQTKPTAPQSVASVTAVGSADVSTASAARISLGLVDTYA